MASAGPSLPSSGGRKSLEADINLVPFIDLLSVCICFLLMTAVWTQIATLEVKQSHGTEGVAAQPKDFEFDVKFQSAEKVELAIKKNGKSVRKITVENSEISALSKSLDEKIKSWLTSIGKTDGAGVVTSAMLTPLKGVSYGEMVAVMDVLRQNQIKNLGIVPVKD